MVTLWTAACPELSARAFTPKSIEKFSSPSRWMPGCPVPPSSRGSGESVSAFRLRLDPSTTLAMRASSPAMITTSWETRSPAKADGAPSRQVRHTKLKGSHREDIRHPSAFDMGQMRCGTPDGERRVGMGPSEVQRGRTTWCSETASPTTDGCRGAMFPGSLVITSRRKPNGKKNLNLSAHRDPRLLANGKSRGASVGRIRRNF